MAFKFPSFGKKKSIDDTGAQTIAPDTIINMSPLQTPSPAQQEKVRQSPTMRLQILGLGLLVVVIAVISLLFRDGRDTRTATIYISIASELRVLSQEVAKYTAQGMQGKESGFTQVKKVGTEFGNRLRVLREGGMLGDVEVHAVPESSLQHLDTLDTLWKKSAKDIAAFLTHQDLLVHPKPDAPNEQELAKVNEAMTIGNRLIRDSDAILAAATELSKTYETELQSRAGFVVVLVLLSVAALTLVALMAKVFFDEAKRRANEAEVQQVESDRINRANQEAILRLMNELGDLADGDLTVMATVSEDITGAIADSINYTIEELRVLVTRINDAAARVTQASQAAQGNTEQLLSAAETQAQEIQRAGSAAMEMSRSMNTVSNHALQSAQVARQSLSAAEKGSQAVEDSMRGMNEIRDQIQETSKRIKRLGESSQEIGEIVELISDITEQTNVLALNAAIQAASAGEAGRGFSIVAEEVQRLAERSGEATKQISAIVKTIQTDTGDAVAAMEQSTQGVVEGARLSDAAAQALAEISQVSRNLAQLIENISMATQKQAQSAASVADNMQQILQVTEQTTSGTQRTAQTVSELSSLANDLKGSVAGFRV